MVARGRFELPSGAPEARRETLLNPYSQDKSRLYSDVLDSCVSSFAVSGFLCGVNFAVQCNSRGDVDVSGFASWLFQRGFSGVYVRHCVAYAQRFWRLVVENRLSFLAGLPYAQRRHALCALSNYSKYVGMHKMFLERLKDAGVNWKSQESWQIFERLFNGAESVSDVESWLMQLKEKADRETLTAVAVIALLGVRPSEGCAALNLVSDGELRKGYLDVENMILQHFRYPKLFLRGSKNVYISVLTEKILDVLRKWEIEKHRKMSADLLLHRIVRKCRMPSRLYDLRRWWATRMRENGLLAEEIDCLQGRLSPQIFLRSYFRPDMSRLFEKTRKILEKLEKKFL